MKLKSCILAIANATMHKHDIKGMNYEIRSNEYILICNKMALEDKVPRWRSTLSICVPSKALLADSSLKSSLSRTSSVFTGRFSPPSLNRQSRFKWNIHISTWVPEKSQLLYPPLFAIIRVHKTHCNSIA